MILRMDSYKNLIITKDTKIYQRESLMDNFLILLPIEYNGIDLSKFTVTWEYINPQSVSYAEILELGEELYKDTYLQYTLPIDSKMAYWEGDITAKISAAWTDPDEPSKSYVLHTSEVTIHISNYSDYYIHTDSETLQTIDNKIADLNAKIGAIDRMSARYLEEMPDDLSLTDNTLLQLSVNGEPIGEGVEFPDFAYDLDDADDGVIDLDGTHENPDVPPDSIAIIDL